MVFALIITSIRPCAVLARGYFRPSGAESLDATAASGFASVGTSTRMMDI